MKSEELLKQLGEVLNIELSFTENGYCSVLFDEDEVVFEKFGSQLYLISELGKIQDNMQVLRRVLSANYLGEESGQATISSKEEDDTFVMHRIIDGDIPYPDFEKVLIIFLKAVRYWKEWISIPFPEDADKKNEASVRPDFSIMVDQLS